MAMKTCFLASQLLTGDCIEVMREMDAESVHCAITSPPYYGLRDYGVEGQVGLEDTPDLYVAKLVAVFRELRRVLRKDGTLWLNLGDSYSGSGPSGASYQSKTTLARAQGDGTDGNFRVSKTLAERGLTYAEKKPVPYPGTKPKDLLGIPWMVAFALRADGWYLRSDIIWSKPNPMPESVIDRPTSAYEHVFLLAKSRTYYYDAEAIREPHIYGGARESSSGAWVQDAAGRPGADGAQHLYGHPAGRNKRNVWEIATQPYPEAHFATFPEKLVEPMVLAGTSPQCCGECGAPWERVVDVGYENPGNRTTNGPRSTDRRHETAGFERRLERRARTTGRQATCDHKDDTGKCVVLDPFAGSGTTLKVAMALGREAIGIELNPEYVALAERRLANVTPPLFAV
jgi:DNA modification methylase